MERQQAIEEYSKIKLKELSPKERAEQLETMILEDWSEVEEWKSLPKSIQKEFVQGGEISNPELERYDPVLLIGLKYSLQFISNEFLCERLSIDKIMGEPVGLESCPCCGFKTIGGRGNYDICTICWWEDDGQDNEHAGEIMGGPNDGISLAMGRYNYLKYGLYDPKRIDLMQRKASENEYKRGRIFEIVDNNYLVEKETDWTWKIIFPDNV